MSYVVVPSFSVLPGQLDAFLDAARADATRSVADEAGCLQFDVLVNRDATPVEVMFYEIYADRAAFEAHLKTPHLAAFRTALDLCEQGPVRIFERVVP